MFYFLAILRNVFARLYLLLHSGQEDDHIFAPVQGLSFLIHLIVFLIRQPFFTSAIIF